MKTDCITLAKGNIDNQHIDEVTYPGIVVSTIGDID